MIKNVKVKYRELPVWARGTEYEAPASSYLFDFSPGKVIFDKSYPRGTPTIKVWEDLREALGDYFIEIMYPELLKKTATLKSPPVSEMSQKYVEVYTPDGKKRWISRHVWEKQLKLSNYYDWNQKIDKFAMTPQGYRKRIEESGGFDIGIALPGGSRMSKDVRGVSVLDILQERYPGSTIILTIFVFPDRYDEEVRCAFDIEITFW